MAKQDLDQFGYCLLENALSPEAATALRTRLVEQAEAEIQRGLDYQGNDGKHMVWFLLNIRSGVSGSALSPTARITD